jgi:uncharacterized membrane protein HdeD (DUF308 family)
MAGQTEKLTPFTREDEETNMAGLDTAGSQRRLFDGEQLQKRWMWFFGLGVVLIVLGAIALGASVFVTLASMLLIGWLLIAGGVLEVIHAFACKEWSGFFIDLLSGLLYVAVGFMIVANPEISAISLTLLIALFLIFGGTFKIAVAITSRYQHWGWLLLSGVVTLALGIMIWRQWPLSGLWVVGLFVGIDMILNGWSLVMLGIAAKRLSSRLADRANR